MAMSVQSIDIVEPASYTTQAKLLLCQLLYDVAKFTPKKFSADHILKSFKAHPLINDPDMKLDVDQLLHLVNNIMLENKMIPREDLPGSIEDYKAKVDLIAGVCNIYFFKRIEEIEARLKSNKEEFQAEYNRIKRHQDEQHKVNT